MTTKQSTPVLISGPSGVGKSHLIERLEKRGLAVANLDDIGQHWKDANGKQQWIVLPHLVDRLIKLGKYNVVAGTASNIADWINSFNELIVPLVSLETANRVTRLKRAAYLENIKKKGRADAGWHSKQYSTLEDFYGEYLDDHPFGFKGRVVPLDYDRKTEAGYAWHEYTNRGEHEPIKKALRTAVGYTELADGQPYSSLNI